MCFKAKTPDLPPKPQVTKREDAATQAQEEARNRLRGRTGRRGTVLTSSLGDPNFGSGANQTFLGGQ